MAQGFERVAEVVSRFFGFGDGRNVIVTSQPGKGAGLPREALQAKAQMSFEHAQMRGAQTYKTRQMKAKDALLVWENDFRPLVLDKLSEAFHPENFKRMSLQVHTSTNVMRRIVEELSILYENPAKRRLAKKEKDVQTDGSTKGVIKDKVDEFKKKKPVEDEAVEEKDGAEAKETEEDDENEEPKLPFGKKEKEEAEPVGDDELDNDPMLNDEPEVKDLLVLLEETMAVVEEGEEDPDSPFSKLMKAYDWDVLLDTVEKLCRFLPCVWVRPMVVYDKYNEAGEGLPADARITFIVYTPDCADIVEDENDPTQAKAFWYWGSTVDENGNTKRIIHFYTKEMYFRFDEEWKEIHREENKLERLPVTCFRLRLPIRKYYCDGEGADLYEGTLEQCVLKTIQNTRARDSGFKQLAIKGKEENIPADQVMGGAPPIYLGDEGEATVLDLAPDLQQFTDLCKERELAYANKYGISSADYKSEGAPESGFAKKLDRDKILKESKRSRKFFLKGEQDLYQNTAKTLSIFKVDSIGVPPVDGELIVDFAEPTFEEDPQTQLKSDAQAMKMNLKSILDLLARENPDLSLRELVRLALKNRKINDVFMTTEQTRLTDILASSAIAGASLDGGNKPPPGGPPGAGGPPKPPFGG